MGEIKIQSNLVKKLRKMPFVAQVMRNDPLQQQGILDLLILMTNGLWAMLEVKASADAPMRPNQEYWVNHYNELGFARFIYPENEEQVLRDLQSTFGSRRKTRIPKSKQSALA